ncbi:MAG: class I SAM-dependent methyltransferase [Acidobacteriota bacterium]|nr:class I SAM-dependent methyltransferase [Acidobacteriota bacterium]
MCDPDARHSLEWDGGNLRNAATGRVFPIREEIPLFVSTLSSASLRMMRRYDWFAGLYDWFELIRPEREIRENLRKTAIQKLDLQAGMRLLEVGIGTGATIPFIPNNVEVFGLDISFNMLRVCSKNLAAQTRTAHLFQGEAARLPFRSEVFDAVFNVGGMSLFSNPARALKEMIWVVKPGGRIVIVDRIVKSDQSIAPVQAAGDMKDQLRPGQWIHSNLPLEIKDIEITPLAENKWFCAVIQKPATSLTTS